MSALVQEKSRSISENIRWSFQKKFKNGELIIDLDRAIGYDWGENGESEKQTSENLAHSTI